MGNVELRARAIAAMGRVERDADGFTVYSTARIPDAFRVWEDEIVGSRCSCDAFLAAYRAGAHFECEHIRAVELWMNPPEDEVGPGEPLAAGEDSIRRVV